MPDMSASPFFGHVSARAFRNRGRRIRTGWDLVLGGVLDDGDDTLELLSCYGNDR